MQSCQKEPHVQKLKINLVQFYYCGALNRMLEMLITCDKSLNPPNHHFSQ